MPRWLEQCVSDGGPFLFNRYCVWLMIIVFLSSRHQDRVVWWDIFIGLASGPSTVGSYHVCQVGGKPNQKIRAAPLRLLPASEEPFEYILIHCVGPLPRCKSGNQYFLTMMCAASTFPEAVFSWKVTASAISNALINSVHCLDSQRLFNPTSAYSPRFSSSCLSSKCTMSTYHPKSQGASEMFHPNHAECLLHGVWFVEKLNLCLGILEEWLANESCPTTTLFFISPCAASFDRGLQHS